MVGHSRNLTIMVRLFRRAHLVSGAIRRELEDYRQEAGRVDGGVEKQAILKKKKVKKTYEKGHPKPN